MPVRINKILSAAECAESRERKKYNLNKIGDRVLKGASGTNYTFHVYPLNTSFEPLPAVYVISKRVSDLAGGGTHTTLYIGQTGDLSERFDCHHKAPCWERRQANCISVLVEQNEGRRLAIETDLVRAINPPCND